MKIIERVRTLGVVLCMGLISLAIPLGAFAQSVVQPPVISVIDRNGVNLATGKFQLPSLDVAIGGSGSGLTRSTQAFLKDVGTADNWSGRGISAAPLPGWSGFTYIFSYGGRSYRFAIPTVNGALQPGPYNSNDGGLEKLACSDPNPFATTGTCIVTLADSTTAVYDKAMGTYLTTVTRPDGEVVTLTYYESSGIKGIKSVSSSLGWMLKYDVDVAYNLNKVTAINSAVTFCDLALSSCPLPSSYPSASLTVSGSTTIISRNGVNAVSYVTTGNVTTLTSPGGVTKAVTTDANGKVTQLVTAGSTWLYSYVTSGSGTETTVTGPAGSQKIFVNNASKMSSQTDEAGRITQYIYDTTVTSSFGRLVYVINPDGSTSTGGYTKYEYDPYNRGNIAKVTVVPKGGAVGGVVTAGAAMITTATYASACDATNLKYCNKPLTTTDADGVTTTYTYHAASGNVASVTLPIPVAGNPKPQTNYTYVQYTPSVKTSATTLTPQNPVWRLSSTSRCMTATAGDGVTLPVCATTADAQTTMIGDGTATASAAYNANLLPLASTTRLGNGTLSQTTKVVYNDNGAVIVTDGPRTDVNDETYAFYDSLGRLEGAVGLDPDGASGGRKRAANWTYFDSDGRTWKTEAGLVATSTYTGTDASARWAQARTDWLVASNTRTVQTSDTNQFDSYGRPTIARHFIGTATTPKDVTQRSYDSLQRLDCEAERLNPVDYSALPASACTLGTTLSDGSHDHITKYGYDILGNVKSTTSGWGTSLARADFLKVYDTTTIISTGNLTYVEDAKGNRTTYTYDGFNRPTKICYPMPATLHASSTSDCERTDYRTTTVTGVTQAAALASGVYLRDNTSATPSITFGYDLNGRLTSKAGQVIESFSYDSFSQVLTHTNNTTGGSAASETYTYNAHGWRLSDAQPAGTVFYEYDVYGKRSKLTYPDGFYVTYSYFDGDDLKAINENGGTSVASFGYDSYGRRSNLNRASGYNSVATYDSSLRLQTVSLPTAGTTSTTVTLAYNAADQIYSRLHSNASYYAPALTVAATTTYGVNGLNQMSPAGPSVLSYDTRGNMTSDGSVTFSNNANNLLTSTSSGATLVYDAENRLRSYTAASVTTSFVYDGTDLIAEYNGSTLLRRYVHGASQDEPLVWYEKNTSGTFDRRYLLADERGSIVGITDAAGNSLAVNRYDEYGVPSTSNATYAGRFRYTGQVWLPEMSMYYYKARMYAPSLGRFLQTDPIGYGDGMNWYAYVGDDPINGSDPSGLCDQNSTAADGTPIIVVCGGQSGCNASCYRSMVDQWAINSYADYAKMNSACNGNIGCEQYAFQHNLRQNVDPMMEKGLVDYLTVITLPANIAGGVAEIRALAFTAKGGAGLILKFGCFTGGTEIATPEGLKPIEDVKVGDLVLSYDETSGQIVAKSITELIRNAPQATYEVKLKNSRGDVDTIRVTADHPWLTASHQWASTNALHADDLIETAQGENLSVISVKATGKVEPIYNFTVADTHTYLVGKSHAIVHNSCLPKVLKGVNSNIDHAVKRALERNIFTDSKTARASLKELSKSLSDGKWPSGTIVDAAGKVLAPIGNGGYAVYKVASNGTAALKTILIAH